MRRAFLASVAWSLVWAALIAVGARLDVPMHPVPMSLQSLAVLAAGVIGGWRIGLAASLLYLAMGALGAPVFAGGAGGWAWLAQTIGAQAAWSGGVQPFLIGAVAKSAALALIAVTIPRGHLKT